jgi:DNA-binding response OmpR family regulator
VWDINYEASSNVIEVFISSLRKKVDRDYVRHLIHTVRGMGYRFGDQDED